MGIKKFHEDRYLKITYLDNSDTDRCLIVFTGVGHAMGGIDVQREEFFSQHALGTVVWVTDKQRSWGNNLDIKKTAGYINRLSAGRETFAIGNSMGGFLAILFSKLLNVKRVMAFVPQFSISPKVVPSETRWAHYRKEIKEIIHEDLSESFSDDVEYALLMGSGGPEEIHYQKFLSVSQRPNIQMFKLIDSDHNVARYLKELNILNECIDVFFSGGSIKTFFGKKLI